MLLLLQMEGKGKELKDYLLRQDLQGVVSSDDEA